MNGKWCEGKRLFSNLRYCLGICWKDLGKLWEIVIGLVSHWTRIWTVTFALWNRCAMHSSVSFIIRHAKNINIQKTGSVIVYKHTSCNNSQNCSVKAKFACLCALEDDGATAGNSLESWFPEYLAVTSCCLGCQECQQIFVPSRSFLILERAKNRRG
jgi:hypothetical protein